MEKSISKIIFLIILVLLTTKANAQNFRAPLNNSGWKLSQDFGAWNSSWEGYHLGEDYVSNDKAELPVYAVSDGTVKHVANHTGYGYVVIIEHPMNNGSKVCSVYGHMRAANITSTGKSVFKGELIGYLSNTYDENGGYNFAHLHFGIRSGGYSETLDSDGKWRYRGYGPSSIRDLWYDGSEFIESHQTSPLPIQSGPLNNSIRIKGNNISFSWTIVSNASYYEIWIDNSSGFGSPEIGYNNGVSSNWLNNGIVSLNSFSLTTAMQNQMPQNLYFWRVRALDASKNPLTDWSEKWIFTLLDEAPNPPNLSYPTESTEIIKGNSLTFTWSIVPNASYYEIWIDNSTAFGSPEIGFNNGVSSNWINDGIISSNSFSFSTTIQNQLPQNLYYWQVRALDSNRNPLSNWSFAKSFKLLNSALNAPNLTAPTENAEIKKGSNITFSWLNVSNASFYEIWIDNSSGFGSPEIGFNNGSSSNWVNNGIISSNIFSLTTSMQNQLPQNLYYWRVRALDVNQKPLTNWSNERVFTLLDPAPNPPNLLNPTNNVEITKGYILTFLWSAVANASFYEIWIDNNSGFGSPEIGFNNGASLNWVYNGIGSSNSFTLNSTIQNRLPQNLYYWKVRALDANKNPFTDFSEVRSFSLLDQNNKTVIIDELNGSTLGDATGITYVPTQNGQGAVLSRLTEGRIEYPFSMGLPREGTIEMLIKVKNGYSYNNYTLLNDQQSAFIFNTGPSDVWYLGAMWLVVSNNGDISLSTALTATPTSHTLSALNTTFRFNEWHVVSFSYGNQGQYLKIDGQLVASNPNYNETLQTCGDWGNKRCMPTIGEIKSVYWANNRFDQGFDGVLDRFRASSVQKDWSLLNSSTTGLTETSDKANSIKLYPNPVADKLIIETSKELSNYDFEIINSAGLLVYSTKLINTTYVNTENFQKGLYFIRFFTNNKIELKKFIKE